MSFERLFSLADLSLVVPEASLEFPPKRPTNEWLAELNAGSTERKQVFFDEQLHSLLLVKIDHPTPYEPADPEHPPEDLLSLLAHVQVSLEATYISPAPIPPPDNRGAMRLSAPPRHPHSARPKSHLDVHPSIYPPNTPNPTPSSGDNDRRYANAEGTLLLASIWGQNTLSDIHEKFTLLWSQEEQVWVAVYQLGLTVAFLRLNMADPLLCLTISATLREKPLILPHDHPYTQYLKSIGDNTVPTEPPSPSVPVETEEEVQEDILDGLEEVNLLKGLFASPAFGAENKEKLVLPSTRLGGTSRRRMFSLGPVKHLASEAVAASPKPTSSARPSHPTIRKSFRKTLETVSGFRVRMRTVFVPYVLLPEVEGLNVNSNEEDDERERLESGSDERTVILCVEVENSGDSGANVGFAVEQVNVKIGGEGAKATLISWGNGPSGRSGQNPFPLYLGSRAQYNLLYAVTFLRSPDDVDGFSLTRDPATGERYVGSINTDLQRAVTINILGKPYHQNSKESIIDPVKILTSDTNSFSFPTQTFSSRWNCVLDLSSHQNQNTQILDDNHETVPGRPNILPEPASPFPAAAPKTTTLFSPAASGLSNGPATAIPGPQQIAMAGKRHTLPGSSVLANRAVKGPVAPHRASTSMLNPANAAARERERDVATGQQTSRSYLPPSIGVQPPRTPTTYGPPPPLSGVPPEMAEPISRRGSVSPGANIPPEFMPPPTPAYPAYPQQYMVPPTPMGQGPISTHTYAKVGPSVEIRRERGMGLGTEGTLAPPTPGPSIHGGFGEQNIMKDLKYAEESGESVVVSVGLVLPGSRPFRFKTGSQAQHETTSSSPSPGLSSESTTVTRENGSATAAPGKRASGKIYPMDYFWLDVFVFNQSMWPRRFEITCPDKRRGRGGRARQGHDVGFAYGSSAHGAQGGIDFKKIEYPGVLPLDYRIRIGPLRPTACQSIRMQFLALTPGVHSIEMLTLTDVESGFSMNLRSVMDIVVHEPEDDG